MAIKRPIFITTNKEVGTGEERIEKERAGFSLRSGRGLESEVLTYKLSDEKTKSIELNAHNDDFLQDVAMLLYYPEKPGEVVRKRREEKSKGYPWNAGNSSGTNERAGSGKGKKDTNRKDYENWKKKKANKEESVGTSLADVLSKLKL